METEEAKIPAPVNPLTVRINLAILRFVREQFFKKWLPNFEPIITSDLRTAEHNAKVGGVPNSTHLHGLAEDFQLKYKNGALVPEQQAKALFDQYILPTWPGFAEFEGGSKGEGYHVHVQLSRQISTYAGLISLAGIGVLGFAVTNNWGKGKI